MKKVNIKTLKQLAVLFSAVVLVSCNKDMDEPSYPAITGDKPTVTLTWDKLELDERDDPSTPDVDESMATLTITSDRLYHQELRFKITLDVDNSTGSYDDVKFNSNNPGADYLTPDGQFSNYGHPNAVSFVLPANTMSTSITLSALLDDLVEDVESMKFSFSPQGSYAAQVPGGAQDFEVTINPKGSNIVDFYGGWDKSFDFAGTTYTLYQIMYDIDFLYADSNNTIVDYFGTYDQMPEHAEVDIDEWGTGTWHIYNTVYDNAGLSAAGITPAFKIPVTLEYYRGASSLIGSYVQTDANAYDSSTPSDPNVSDVAYCYSFTINADNTVTIFDQTTGLEIGTGRSVATPKALGKLKGLSNLNKRK